MKKVVIINGKGGVGKDTLCSFIANKYSVMNVSSITPIKNIAMQIGWNGEKNNKSRKLLSDLKKIATEYNDFPNLYLLGEYKRFLQSNHDILFVHIREKEQIEHFINTVQCKVITLLIKQKSKTESYGNNSDDNVEDFNYDYVYHNDKPLEEAENDFSSFFSHIISL